MDFAASRTALATPGLLLKKKERKGKEKPNIYVVLTKCRCCVMLMSLGSFNTRSSSQDLGEGVIVVFTDHGNFRIVVIADSCDSCDSCLHRPG